MLYTGLSINTYTQIGIIMLIGLVAKNGILIVEFANQLRDDGKEISEAVYEASVIRLRPILMTTIATALGASPLALSTGAGAESRNALGIVIIGGVLFATVLSLFLIPVLYRLLARLTKPTGYIARSLGRDGNGVCKTGDNRDARRVVEGLGRLPFAAGGSGDRGRIVAKVEEEEADETPDVAVYRTASRRR